jgi:hypothetical protein
MITNFFNFKLPVITEGMLAHTYSNKQQRQYILDEYKKTYPEPTESPLSHPWKFDPLNPPDGWGYDPYYEIWVQNF